MTAPMPDLGAGFSPIPEQHAVAPLLCGEWVERCVGKARWSLPKPP